MRIPPATKQPLQITAKRIYNEQTAPVHTHRGGDCNLPDIQGKVHSTHSRANLVAALFDLCRNLTYVFGETIIAIIGIIVLGVLTLALQNCRQAFWVKNKSRISLIFNTIGALLFIISSQPYAAALLFVFLIIKVFMLVKWQ